MLAPLRLDILGRRQRRAPITEGAVYRRRSGNDVIETARVLSVDHDLQGIQHVRFHVNICRGDVPFVDEERMLNVHSFAERYGQPIEA
ncbi:hypothetical protein SAMN05216241_10235 [Limimonas halophila]|uniref:Uncharacterized protein n=1 Tax=Limimonas halophila TaxID=1082479 RepID=A0A1G7N664_9PROT|nr:hypothetical protein [Limimonas halophila]SDF69442.1 hypothetical protein SAMN05216241_10235 [Limimonas halophila]